MQNRIWRSFGIVAVFASATLLSCETKSAQAQPASPPLPQATPPGQSTGSALTATFGEDISLLRQAGIVTGAGATRGAAASAVARGLGDVLRWPAGVLQTSYDRNSVPLSALIRLIVALEPELRGRGVDTRGARERLAALTLSRDHWAYQAVDRLRGAPIEVGYGRERRPPWSRQEFAAAAAAFQAAAARGKEALSPERRDLAARLAREFESEIGLLPLSRKDEEVSAMEKLHRAGILIGYPGDGAAAKPGKAGGKGK